MKIFTNGAKHWGSQLPRIEDGFRALGHEITPHVSEASLIYSNNDHAGLVADRIRGDVFKPGAKLILTCLDVPTHISGYDIKPLAKQLGMADAVCTISEFVQWQVKTLMSLDSTVIYQPIKRITRQPGLRRQPFPRFASIGRRTDPNKATAHWMEALQLLGYTARDVALVGNEPGWGEYIGVLNDDNLNVVYNSVDFVLATGVLEGLNLPVLEAMASGAVPVVNQQLTTLDELLPPDVFPEYRAFRPDPTGTAYFISSLVNQDSGERLAELKERLHQHFMEVWGEPTSPKGVVRRILAVYDSLT